MSRLRKNIRVVPSVLDRLLGGKGGVSSDASPARGQSVQELKKSVRRDLLWLLNTRQMISDRPEEADPEAERPVEQPEGEDEQKRSEDEWKRSFVCYGLPDLLAVKPLDEKSIAEMLKEVIERFEPRLRKVKVDPLPTRTDERALRFLISARLPVEPLEEVTFDTVLQIYNGEYLIEAR